MLSPFPIQAVPAGLVARELVSAVDGPEARLTWLVGVYLTTVAVTVGAAGLAAGLAAVSAGARARQRAARDACAGEVEAALAGWVSPPAAPLCCGGSRRSREGSPPAPPAPPSDRAYRALHWLAAVAAGGAWVLAAWMVLLFAAHVSASMAMSSVVRGTGQAIQSLEAAVAATNQTLGAARSAGTALAGLTAGLTAQARQAATSLKQSLPPSAGALAEAVRSAATHHNGGGQGAVASPKPPPVPPGPDGEAREEAAEEEEGEQGGGLTTAATAGPASPRQGGGAAIAAGLSSAFKELVGSGEDRPGTLAPSARLVAPKSGPALRRRRLAAEGEESVPTEAAADATPAPSGSSSGSTVFPRFDPSAAANGMLSIINALQPTQQDMLTAAAGAQRVAESARRVVGGASGGLMGDGGGIPDGTVCPSVVCLDVRLFAFLKSDACICTAADLHTVRALATDVGKRVQGSLVGVVLMYVGASALLARLAADAARVAVDRGVVWGDLHAVHARRRAAARGEGEGPLPGGGGGRRASGPPPPPPPARSPSHHALPAPSAPVGTPTLGVPKAGSWLPGL